MLSQAEKLGYLSDCCNAVISSTGKRFPVGQAMIWAMQQPDGTPLGQGATFTRWRLI